MKTRAQMKGQTWCLCLLVAIAAACGSNSDSESESGTGAVTTATSTVDSSAPSTSTSEAASATEAGPWTITTLSDNPSPRMLHTAVWTGSTMLVWGGIELPSGGAVRTGGIYDPEKDSWTAMTTTGAPTGRYGHTAVWAGDKMLIWGGEGRDGSLLNDGAMYDPVTDKWTALTTTDAPSARLWQGAVWTGSKMLIWGGLGSNLQSVASGALYDPATDTWASMASANGVAFVAGPFNEIAWTGSALIAWNGLTTAGAIYDPTTDTWTALTSQNAPQARFGHSATWNGYHLIVAGGWIIGDEEANDGAIYDLNSDSWRSLPSSNAPNARWGHSAAWIDDSLVIWGGWRPGAMRGEHSGRHYRATTDSWLDMDVSQAPIERVFHSTVNTGSKMIVWGGSLAFPAVSIGQADQVLTSIKSAISPTLIP